MKKPLIMTLALVASAAHAQVKPLTAAGAKAKALALVSGKVLEVEKEKHNGEPVFSVEIKAKDGVHELVFRITDGKLVANKLGSEEEGEEGEEGDDN
jgi:uncharacterized membrane protein YkoI